MPLSIPRIRTSGTNERFRLLSKVNYALKRANRGRSRVHKYEGKGKRGHHISSKKTPAGPTPMPSLHVGPARTKSPAPSALPFPPILLVSLVSSNSHSHSRIRVSRFSSCSASDSSLLWIRSSWCHFNRVTCCWCCRGSCGPCLLKIRWFCCAYGVYDYVLGFASGGHWARSSTSNRRLSVVCGFSRCNCW